MAVAALGDLDISEVAGSRQAAAALHGQTGAVARRADALPAQRLLDGGDDIAVAVKPGNGVDLRDLGGQLTAVALGQTAGDNDSPQTAGLLFAHSVENGGNGLLLGGIDKAAGVDDGAVGRRGIAADGVAGLLQRIGHAFGIDTVLVAAE